MNEALSEALNGNVGIAALSLTIICAIYLVHQTIALKTWGRDWRRRATAAMRLAAAVMTLSIGAGIRSAEVVRWRMTGGAIGDLRQGVLTIGTVVALVGFLCCIREISKPLYGDGPWVWTLVTMILYSVVLGIWRAGV